MPNKTFRLLANLNTAKQKRCRIKDNRGFVIYQGTYNKTAKQLRKRKGYKIDYN